MTQWASQGHKRGLVFYCIIITNSPIVDPDGRDAQVWALWTETILKMRALSQSSPHLLPGIPSKAPSFSSREPSTLWLTSMLKFTECPSYPQDRVLFRARGCVGYFLMCLQLQSYSWLLNEEKYDGDNKWTLTCEISWHVGKLHTKLANVMLSERSQSQKVTYLWFHLYETSRIGKSTESEID